MFQQFSPNMLKTYEQCPKKFYFKYVKHISMPINDEKFEFGKNIHALASYYLKNENIIKMEASLKAQELVIWEYLKKLKYFTYEVINTEYNLSIKIDNCFLGGRIDALVKNEGEYFILDYKTGGAPKNAKYDFQTMVYLLAVEAFFNTTNVHFVYIDLKNKNELIISLTSKLKSEYVEKLTETIKSINTQEFTSHNKNCSCEYSLICY